MTKASSKKQSIRVAYLYTGYRQAALEKVQKGEMHSAGFWGMLDLHRFGIEAEHVEVEQVYSWRISQWLRKLLNVYWIHLPVFWKLFGYDIVFTSTAFGSQLVHALLHIRRPVWVMHDFSISGLIGEGKTLKQKLLRYAVSRARGIVTLSTDEEKKLKQMFPHLASSIVTIPFGVDLNFFTRDDSVEEQRQILGVGFDPDRDWKTLIQACEGLGVPLVLATLPDRVRALEPLPSFVQVQAFTMRELVHEYRKAQIVVIPLDTSKGINDAMGCSMLFEAMAMQKAIIATETFTVASYLEDGHNGVLVEEGNVTQLQHALVELLEDPAKRSRLGHRARAYAEAKLDARVCSEQLASFFRSLLGRD